MKCEVCGSTNLIKENGEFVCKGCGVKYSLEEIKKMNDLSLANKQSITTHAYPNNSVSVPASLTLASNVKSTKSVLPTHPKVKSKLVTIAKVLAVLAVIIQVMQTIISMCCLEFVAPIFHLIFICLAAGAVFSIKKGKRGSDAIKRIPAVFLGYSVYNCFYLDIFSSSKMLYKIKPAIWVLLLILMLVFIKKELPDGKLLKTKITGIIAVIYSFGLANTIGYLIEKKYGITYSIRALYGTSLIDSFFRNIKLVFSNPFEFFKTYLSMGRLNVLSSRYSFLVELFIMIAFVLLLFAIGNGDVEKSSDEEVKANRDMLIGSIVAGFILVGMLLVGSWLASLDSCSDSSGGSNSNGYCQFEGCSKKAVGPTYEFCEYHKKMLNNVWELERAQNN